MTPRSLALGAAALALAAGLFALARRPAHEPAPGPADSGQAVPPAADVRTLAEAEVLTASAGPPPASLRGSQVDGSLALDGDGRFLPTPGSRRLFDYFLSASGEEPLEVIRGRLLLHLRSVLPAAAVPDATAALDRYLAYREALRELVQGGAAPADLERRLQWIRELRRAELGPELARAFYEREEAVAQVDLERRRVLLDPSLDEDERAERLADLDARLPEGVRSARARASAPQRVQREVDELREWGASDTEVFAVRERAFGSDAAERLADLDRSRAVWEGRLARYRDARDALLSDASLQDDARAGAVEALRAEHFAPDERVRVAALERAGAL